MLDAGRAYCQTSKSFVNGLLELGHQCSRDQMMKVKYNSSVIYAPTFLSCRIYVFGAIAVLLSVDKKSQTVVDGALTDLHLKKSKPKLIHVGHLDPLTRLMT